MSTFDEVLKEARKDGWKQFIISIEGGNVIYYDDISQKELHATNKKTIEKDLPLYIKSYQLKTVVKNIDYTLIASLMKKERRVKRQTKKDIDMIIYASETNDWKEVYQSKLYNDYSGHYCSLLCVLCDLKLLGNYYEVI